MALVNQPFPSAAAKIVEGDGRITESYRYLLESLWTRTGQAPGVSSVVVQSAAAAAQKTANLGVINAAGAQTTANLGVLNANAAQTTADAGVATATTATAAAATAQAGADASLKIANNLSDLAVVATAQANLGLGPIATSATATGWSGAIGTMDRSTFNGSFTQTASATYVQAELAAVSGQVTTLSHRMAALITDLIATKTIGP